MDKVKLYKTIIPLNVVSDTTLTLCIGEDSYKQYCKKIKVSHREDVDTLTARLEQDGYQVVSYPRVTGDGYYESCIVGPEGILIEDRKSVV